MEVLEDITRMQQSVDKKLHRLVLWTTHGTTEIMRPLSFPVVKAHSAPLCHADTIQVRMGC